MADRDLWLQRETYGGRKRSVVADGVIWLCIVEL